MTLNKKEIIRFSVFQMHQSIKFQKQKKRFLTLKKRECINHMVRIGCRTSFLMFGLGLLMFSAHIYDTTAQENSVRNGEADVKSENVDRKERTNAPPQPPRQNPTRAPPQIPTPTPEQPPHKILYVRLFDRPVMHALRSWLRVLRRSRCWVL